MLKLLILHNLSYFVDLKLRPVSCMCLVLGAGIVSSNCFGKLILSCAIVQFHFCNRTVEV